MEIDIASGWNKFCATDLEDPEAAPEGQTRDLFAKLIPDVTNPPGNFEWMVEESSYWSSLPQGAATFSPNNTSVANDTTMTATQYGGAKIKIEYGGSASDETQGGDDPKDMLFWTFEIDTLATEGHDVVAAGQSTDKPKVYFDPKPTASPLWPWDEEPIITEVIDENDDVVADSSGTHVLLHLSNVEDICYTDWDNKNTSGTYVDGGLYRMRITLTKEDQSVGKQHEIAVVEINLKQVSFDGTKYHTVKSDDGTTDYTAPHWQDNSSPLDGDADDPGDKKYPICFTRNTKMKTSAKWHVEPSNLGITIKVKGDGPGNLDLSETTASISGNDMTITDVVCSNSFKNEIDFFDPMSIAWKWSLDDGSTWYDAGSSENQTYVTLGDPLTTAYHTLAHLGCKNADGESTAANCTTKIWNEFTDRDVRRVDGVRLTYYASYTCGNVTTASLLASGDGQCGAWAKFFIDMRKIQGIDDTNEYVIFDPITDDGFIVKNWTFTGGGSSGHPTHPYLNIPDSPLIGATSYNWKFAEVNDAAGIPGQGNPNPASLFNNHQVVISGAYYDPSYGVKHATLQDVDSNSIDGFYIGPGGYPVDEPTVNLDLNGDGDKTDLGINTTVMLFRKNPAGLDIKETRLDY